MKPAFVIDLAKQDNIFSLIYSGLESLKKPASNLISNESRIATEMQ